MASKRKIDDKLISYFNKLKPIQIDTRLSIRDQYMSFWNTVIENTPLCDQCSYIDNGDQCSFIIADSTTQYHVTNYTFRETHDGDDPGDICWDIILYDALSYIKKNKLIQKSKK